MLGMKARIKTLHIPYRGLAPALTDVMAGQVDMIVVAASTAAPYIKEGKLVPIAITGPSRLAMLPSVPSMADGGFPDFNAHSWYSFVVRRGTPDHVVQKIHRDVNAVLQKEKERLVALGLVPSGKGLAEFAALMSEESRRWAGVITAAGIAQK
jgi:tripartite-type tricarboxylate transporter receptor subunit TctC